MKLSIQLKKEELQQYIEICEKLWGCVPLDVEWAANTNSYRAELLKQQANGASKDNIED